MQDTKLVTLHFLELPLKYPLPLMLKNLPRRPDLEHLHINDKRINKLINTYIPTCQRYQVS